MTESAWTGRNKWTHDSHVTKQGGVVSVVTESHACFGNGERK